MRKIQHVLPFLSPHRVRRASAGHLASLGPHADASGSGRRRVTAHLHRTHQRKIALPRKRRHRATTATLAPAVTVHRDALRQTAARLAHHLDRAGRNARAASRRARAQCLAARIVESIALPSGADLRLLRVDGPPNFVEIGAGIRLQAVSPILRTGVSSDAPQFDIDKVSGGGNTLTVDLKSSPDLIGFETAWYDLRPKTAGAGFTIVASSAETNIKGKVESQPAPARNYFQFAPEIGFYRLFYKADQTEVLAAATHAHSAARRSGNLRSSGRTRLPGDSARRRSQSLYVSECEREPCRGGNQLGLAKFDPDDAAERRQSSTYPGNHQVVGGQTRRAGVRPLQAGHTQPGVNR